MHNQEHPVPEPLSDYPELPAGEQEPELPAAGRGVTDIPVRTVPKAEPYYPANHIAPKPEPAVVTPDVPAPPADHLHDMNSHPAASPRARYKGPAWAAHTRFYVLEYLLSNLFLVSFIWLSNYPIYYLAGYILGHRSSEGIDSAWILGTVSYAIVVFPLLALLLRRTLGEEELHPLRYKQHPRKILLNLAVFYSILASVGYGLAGVYLLLSPLIKESTGSEALAYGIASFVLVGLHLLMLLAISRKADGKPSRLGVALMVSGLALLLSFVAFGVSIGPTRGAATDKQTLEDISVIDQKISEYVRQEGKLPGGLDDLKLDEKVLARGAKHAYTYEQKGSTGSNSYSKAYKYKLCADFLTETGNDYEGYYRDQNVGLSYVSQTASHPKGTYCFDMVAYSYSRVQDLDIEKQ